MGLARGRRDRHVEMLTLLDTLPTSPEIDRIRKHVTWASYQYAALKSRHDDQMKGHEQRGAVLRTKYRNQRRKNWLLRLAFLKTTGTAFRSELDRLHGLAAEGHIAFGTTDGHDAVARLAFLTTCQQILELTGINIEQVFERSRHSPWSPSQTGTSCTGPTGGLHQCR